uniref:Uncharacterized protein n=1 Tax=Arundo donax TaxID=35708 RepID=A0A0A9BR20_ARUDO
MVVSGVAFDELMHGNWTRVVQAKSFCHMDKVTRIIAEI